MRSTDVAPAGASSAVEHRTSNSPARAAPPISPAASLSAVGRFNQFLSSIAMLPPAADFFAAAATAMANLIGARFLGLSLYDAAANTLTCHALVAPPELACALREHRAQSPLGATIDIPSATARQALLCGKLQSILHDDQRLVFGQVSAEVCERIKSALGITTCYAVGMTWRGAIVGCIMFAMPDAGVLDADLVEACAHQVAALYQQRTTERMLGEANVRLEARVSERTAQFEAAHQAMLASEEKYRRLFHNAQAGMFRTRMDGSAVLEVNETLARILRRPSAEIVGQSTLLNWAEPEKRTELLRLLQTSNHIAEFEMPMLTGDGSTRTLLLSITAYPAENLLEGTAIDITERKAMEKAMRESERRIADLLHNLPGMVYRCRYDPTWTMEFVSEGGVDLTGYPAEALIDNRQLAYTDLIDPADHAAVSAAVQAAVQADRSFEITYRIRTAAGDQRWVWEKGSAVRDAEGAVVALEGFITDITEVRVAQEAVRASEERFRAFFEATSIGTALVDGNGRIIVANPALSRYLGYTAAELVGMSIADITDPDDYAADAEQLAQLLAGAIPAYTMEKRYVTHAGTAVWGLLTASLVRDANGAPLFLIGQVQDIDERKRVQAELEQLYLRTQQDAQEKALLLNEVNHRVKNNLMAILGLLLAESEFAPPAQRPLVEASYQNIARRIKSLLEVHRMLSASEWSPLSLSELIARVIYAERSGYALGDRVAVQVAPSTLQVSPRQASNLALIINELFANSCKHAVGALPTLQVTVTLALVDGAIQIEYRDNGAGYLDEVLNQQRLGVGFYLIRRIVEGTLRGSVTLTNDGGAVTCIRIPVDRREHTGEVMRA